MFLRIAAHELRYRFTHLQVHVYFVVFAALAYLSVLGQAGVFGGGTFGQRLLNGPYHVAEGTLIAAIMGVLISMGFVGQAVYRDFHHNTAPLFFTTPISKADYLFGRYVGSVLAVCFILFGFPLGLYLASVTPFLDPARFGPTVLEHYLRPYLIFVVPTVIFTGALFIALAALTRRMMINYVGGVVLFVAYLMSFEFVGDLERRTLAALLDPFGYQTFTQVTQYWTVVEQNEQAIAFSGLILYNRLIWLAVGLAILAFAYWRFRPGHEAPAFGGRRTARARAAAAASPVIAMAAQSATPASAPAAGAARPVIVHTGVAEPRAMQQFVSLARQEFLGIVRNGYFLAILVCALTFLALGAYYVDQSYGTTVYPVTGRVAEWLSTDFYIFFLILTTFIGGELVWRERDQQTQQFTDALPVAEWVPLAAKYVALLLMHATLLLVILLNGVAVQVLKGYYRFELGLYLQQLYLVQWPQLALLSMFVLGIHVLANHKYAAHFMVVLFYVFVGYAATMGIESKMLLFGEHPGIRYSDMNRYGHFVMPYTVFTLYWGAFALALAMASRLLWVRGEESGWRWRAKLARRRTGRLVAGTASLGLLLFSVLGATIHYNTKRLNEFVPTTEQRHRDADYERQYRHLAVVPQPRLVQVSAEVHMYPERRRVEARGTFAVVNRSAEPIAELYMHIPRHAVLDVDMDRPHERVIADDRLRMHAYRLLEPLTPGETLRIEVRSVYEPRGFENVTGRTEVVANGTFISPMELFPLLGYQARRELDNEHERRREGLPPATPLPPPDDLAGRMNSYIGPHADWSEVDIVISTSADQIAIAPGSLLREWTENGRRYFHYSNDGAPMLAFAAFLSARYEVARERWQEIDLEVYHHPTHTFNVERFQGALKRSLEYLTANFGPYQFRQARIVEFPRYNNFAQALPGTMPYSEGIGFIARVRDGHHKDIDYPLYITAHEVAHQWWAHQVIGGAVQGSELLSEGLASYTALRILEQAHGPHQMRRFLEYELDRYLQGRSNAAKPEVPLLYSDRQGYIHYQKAALVLYTLSDYIGEARLNRALREFRDRTAFQQPPYTSSLELYEHLRGATPESLHGLLADLFEHITLWDLRTERATSRELGDGRFEVTLDIRARKLRVDGRGAENEIPLGDWIDVGVFTDRTENGRKQQHPLHLQKHRITAGENRVVVIVDEAPLRAGVDPYLKLIDRNKRDNTVSVSRN
jgi:ABC-2 type transport system permease protein